MSQGLVFSPSNLISYATCPLSFYGKSISKEIKWKSSAQKSRGTLVHAAMQKAFQQGIAATPSLLDDQIDAAFTTDKVSEVRRAMSQGAQLFIEHELCVNRAFKETDWWGDDAFLRARADAVILPPHIPDMPPFVQSNPLIIDIKTGKKYDDDMVQLRITAMLVHLIHQCPVVDFSYYYVDEGIAVENRIDFRNGLGSVQDIISLIKDVQQAIKNNYFPPKKNRFCKWCDFFNTSRCTL